MTDAVETPTRTARRLLRGLDRATLATAQAAGWPYASLVLVATAPDGGPLLLISTLAEHTKNLQRDPRASLLFDGTAGFLDPLTGPRVTILGELTPQDDPGLLARFTNRHPSAALYAGFKDFHLYRLAVTRAHLVAGFGRIDWIEGAALLRPSPPALAEAEPGVLAHMNGDHAATLDLYAQKLLLHSEKGWSLTGIDAEGADLRCGGTVARLDFPAPVADADGVRTAFIALAQQARTAEIRGAAPN